MSVHQIMWNRAQHLLTEYDGAASELFVIGLPISELDRVIAALATLPELEVLSFSDESIDLPAPFDESWRERLSMPQEQSCEYTLRSCSGSSKHLQVYIELNSPDSELEVEFVFWNDLSFSRSRNLEEKQATLNRIVALAESCRAATPSAKCIMVSEYNGDPRELLNLDEAIVW